MNDRTWHENMHADLVFAGMAQRTQEAYLRAVRQLSQYYNGTPPEALSEQQVKDYLLWLRAEKRAAPGTLKIAIGGLRFFYGQTCPRQWTVGDRFRIPKEKRLPTVLAVLEVRRIMHAIRPQVSEHRSPKRETQYCLQQIRMPGQIPREHTFRGSIPFTVWAASPVHSFSLPFCVRFNAAVTSNAATLDTGPPAKSYPSGVPSRLSMNHFQFAPDPHAGGVGGSGAIRPYPDAMVMWPIYG